MDGWMGGFGLGRTIIDDCFDLNWAGWIGVVRCGLSVAFVDKRKGSQSKR